MMAAHSHVPHPRDLLPAERAAFAWLNRILTTTLGSNAVFLLCFIVPLLAVPASATVKVVVALIFSNWFQAWALPVLQKGQAQGDLKRDAKMDADHVALTYLAEQVDEINKKLAALSVHSGPDEVR
jgi:hypothetical protein